MLVGKHGDGGQAWCWWASMVLVGKYGADGQA